VDTTRLDHPCRTDQISFVSTKIRNKKREEKRLNVSKSRETTLSIKPFLFQISIVSKKTTKN
jgi:hypothetical protein